uniref:Ubiquitin-like domain-containing protein n=1 Tax=Acrobeloides nanus TaxID=290746 RepID=A0A914CDZ8_9BILA
MQISLVIDIQDNDEQSHDRTALEFSDEITVQQLKERIKSLWKIDDEYQRLFHKEKQILSLKSTLKEIGIKNDDEIIVKHGMLSVWAQFLSIVELVEVAKNYDKPRHAKKAIQIRDQLINADFFRAYSKFIPIEKNTRQVIAHFEDNDDTKIKNAAIRFFEVMYGKAENPQIKIEFRQKAIDGMQGGFICDVKREAEITSFFLKIHSARSSRSVGQVDICELFVYRLLYLINMGPEVFFIPNVHYSTFALYIATREVDGFKEPKLSQVGNEQMTIRALLKSIFYLTDLHNSNYGLDKDDQLVIVDFQIDDISSGSDKIWKKYIREDKSERCRIGKEALKSFSLDKKIDEADSSLEETKNMLRDRDINCHWSKYSRYLKKVKSNVIFFENKFAAI